MTSGRLWGWLLTLVGVLTLFTWGLAHRSPLLPLALLTVVVVALVSRLWRPYLGRRRTLRVRYHSPTPPDPLAMSRCLAPLLRYGALVLRWRYDGDRVGLWVELPAHLEPILASLLPTALPDVHLERDAPPPLLGDAPICRWPLRGAGSGETTDPLNFAATLVPQPPVEPGGELRLVLFGPQTAALLILGTPKGALATIRRVRWLPNHLRLRAMRTWLLRHYPLGEAWPPPARRLPPLRLPATTHPLTAGLDTQGSYQIAPTPSVPAHPGPALALGISTATRQPVRMPLPTRAVSLAPIWTRHFLSLGESPHRYHAVEQLAKEALSLDMKVVLLDPAHTLLPRLSLPLSLHIPQPPQWINRSHPRGSLRLNLLAVPPLPGLPAPHNEVAALRLAMTSALPLWDRFLARLGATPWSSTNGDVLLHDLALLALLGHHRARLGEGAPPLPPTPYSLYGQLATLKDLRPLAEDELRAWTNKTLAVHVLDRTSGGPELLARVRSTLETANCRWDSYPPAVQQEAAGRLADLLRPVLDHPGLLTFWQGANTAPAAYFNAHPAPLTFTHLLPALPTSTDRALAGWYAEYLLLTLIAAGQARRAVSGPTPPLLLILDDLGAWWESGLVADHLLPLGEAGITVAGVGAHLPPPPDGPQLLDAFGTWWVHNLHTADVPPVVERLTMLDNPSDLPLTHLPADTALLRTTVPYPTACTVYTTADPAREAGS